jgi:hypothetical protein
MYQDFQSISHPHAQHFGELSLTCPHCQRMGSMKPVVVQDVLQPGGARFYGMRTCPNPECKKIVFIIGSQGDVSVIKSYPVTSIQFEKGNIPLNVLEAFEQAIICHSHGCYIAAGIMLRKTLEEIAHDKGIKADNLFKRIKLLGENIVIPKDLTTAMDELRLLGNDAAHIEARTYNEIGQDEIEISIEFTKEILKATYQFEDLLAKLRSLKKDKKAGG